MSEHTPGPWTSVGPTGFPEVRIVANTHYIAIVGHSDDTQEQTDANGRLIAAAPDLLEACRSVLGKNTVDLEFYKTEQILVPLTLCELRAIRDAIEKATGKKL